jgi:Transglycosylase SLT domain
MANWTENDLKRQFERAKKNGWIKTFKSAAATYQFPPEVLMAIASRETNMRNIIGDGGHGYGLMQIDDRSFPEWCNSGLWKDPHAGIQKGALVLHSKQQTIRNGQGKSLRVGGRPFVGKANISKDDLLRTAVAGYNSGLWAYYNLTKYGDPDRRTTGRDYSKDTLRRAQTFGKLLRSS